MPVTIENLTMQLVLLRLNSGQTLHIAPRITSEEIMDVEVENNAKVQKLKERHVIAVHPVAKKERTHAGMHEKEKEKSIKGKK